MKTLDELRSERSDLEADIDELDRRIDDLENERRGAEYEMDEIDMRIEALERSLGYAVHDGDMQIIHVTITPEMQELAAQARGKSWDELRELNAQYERIALRHAVVAEVDEA